MDKIFDTPEYTDRAVHKVGKLTVGYSSPASRKVVQLGPNWPQKEEKK